MEIQPIDLTSQAFKRDPMPTFAKLREQGPVVRAKLPMVGETWLTTTYEATNRVLRDSKTFVNDPRNAGRRSIAGIRWWMPKWIRAMAQNMLGKDEPDHRRLRELVDHAFDRQSIDDLRPRITKLVDRHLDRLEVAAGDDKQVDFIKHFSRPLPVSMICELLGLPDEDHAKFIAWSNLGAASSMFGFLKALRGMRKMLNYLKRQIAEFRKHPRPGMLSALVNAEMEGNRLNEQELLASAFLLFVAGHETTVHLLNGGLMTLEQHPDQKAKLLADWSLADSAVDEILRYFSSIQMTKPRYASRDVEIYDQQIKQGEFFTPLLGAANCDPAEFPNPEQFDVERTPNRHLAFGTGPHVCLGMKLAKAEVGIAYERLYSRFPNLSLPLPPSELTWSERIGTRSVEKLPLVLNHCVESTQIESSKPLTSTASEPPIQDC